MKHILFILLTLLPLAALPQATTTFWSDDCEGSGTWTTSGPWSYSSRVANSSSNSIETEGNSTYSINTSYVLNSETIDLSNYSNNKLTFYMQLDTDETYDGAFIEGSADDGVTWSKFYNAHMNKPYDGKLPSVNVWANNLAWYSNVSGWTQVVVDLSDYEGCTTFKFRITFGTDNVSTADYGMNVDDFAIYGYPKTTIHNSDGLNQLVFNNSFQYITDPVFSVSSDVATSFDRFKVEINKSPQFSDISHIQEFGAAYTNGTQYTLTCDQLNPVLNYEDNTTYFVRVAASADNGVTWGKWSNIISFTWKPTETSDPQWYQQVDYQFGGGTLSGVENVDDAINYKSTIAVTSTIASTTDDAYDFFDGTQYYYDALDMVRIGYNSYAYTSGFRFANMSISQGATINKAFMAFSCHYPDNPGFGISNSIDVDIYIEDTDDAATFANTGTERPSGRSVTSKIDWTFSDVWYDYSFYQTPDLTSLIQATVNRAGWSSGNAIALIMEDGAYTNYRKIRTIDSDPSHAAKLYVEYENTAPGTIISEPIELASFDGAANWGRLYWDAEGTAGTFEVTVQYDNSGTWTDIATYAASNVDLSVHDSYATLRLVGTFTPDGSGNAPTLKSWTITTDDPSANDSDLTLSLNADDLTPCVESTIHYTLSVANNGPDEAVDIEVAYAIPAGLTLVDTNVDKGAYDSGTWEMDALQNGETAILNVWVTVNSGQGGNTITSNPSVTLFNADPDATNNSVSLDVLVNNNTAPQISTIADQQTSFNTAFSTISFTVNDAETSEDLLTYSAVADNAALIPDANFTFDGSGINRTLDIVQATNQYGSTNVTITADDGTCAATETFVAQVVRHQYSTMESATMVIGQPDFTTVSLGTTASKSPGASSCGISPLGVLAVGSQYTSAFQGDDGRVMIWDEVPTVDGAACDIVLGKTGVTTEESDCTASLTKAIDGVAFSADGTKLLVSDAGNHRILIWNSIPNTTGQAADVVIGQSDFITGTSGCSSTKLNVPKSLVVTPDGRLFIADNGNNRVLVYNTIPTTNEAAADVVIGQDDFNTNTSGNAAHKMNGPWDITISTDGKLLVSDVNNNRVLVFNAVPTQNGASADYVIGQEDFGISSAGLAVNKFNVPIGVTVSPTGILAVAEFVNHRVLIFNQVPQENGASADIVLGQGDFTSNIGYSPIGTPADDNFNNPYTIYFDINDRLFVNGRDMNRVMVFGDEPTDVSDLAVAIATDINSPCMGNPVAYTIDITNNGPADATNVVVNAALPDGFYYFDHAAERGTYYPAGGNWQVPNLANNETISLTITGTVNYGASGKTIEAYASVRSNNQKESDFSNNSASKSINVLESNYTPIVSRIADQSKNVGIGTGVINFTVTDENGDAMTVTATSSNQSVVTNSNITLVEIDNNDRSIEITPEPNVHGVTTITVTVTDGNCTSNETFEASFGNLWIGKTADWHTEANWGGEVPKTGVDIFIPASPQGGNFPLISNDATVRDIIIEEGAELNANNPIVFNIEGDVTNDGTVNIAAGTTLFKNNPTSISGSGSIQMHHVEFSYVATIAQDMSISGIWTTSGNNTVTHTAGTITFNGSAAQTIANAESFNGLGVDNAAGLTLSSDVNVADTLKLTDGVITASGSFTLANNLTIVRTSGSLGAAPTFGATTNIVYEGSVTTGNEIPATNTINDLRLNNSGIEVTLGASLTVDGELEFANGVITTGANSLEMSSTTAANLIGGSETSFVNGTLARAISSNTDTYLFPIGNGAAAADYLPVEFVNASLVGTNSLTASSHSISTGGDNIDDNLTTTETGGNNYINVIEDGGWYIVPNTQPSSGTYGLRLYFNSAIATSLTDNQFGILKRPTGSTSYADWESFGSSTTVPDADSAGRTIASGYAERLGLESFSEFAIANAEWPLPVNLISFTGKWENQRVLLEWETASEQQNDYFVIEKSTDAIHFNKLARVDGQGNSTSTTKYQLFDEEISNHTYYYRLKQVDFDGDEHYEGVVAVKCPIMDENLDVYPIPASDELNVELYAYQNSSITMSLVNAMGQVVITDKQEIFQGRQALSLDVKRLQKGWYVLQIKYDDKIVRKSVMID